MPVLKPDFNQNILPRSGGKNSDNEKKNFSKLRDKQIIAPIKKPSTRRWLNISYHANVRKPCIDDFLFNMPKRISNSPIQWTQII